MAMNFIQVVDDCVALLIASEAGKYKAIGNQIITDSPAESFKQGDPAFLGTVRAFHKSSRFPTASGSRNSPVTNEIIIALEFKSAAKAKGDLAVLSDENADPDDVIVALAAIETAELLANSKMDNLFSTVYNIIMDLQNKNLGSLIKIGSRWIPQYEKDDPVRFGSIVSLTGGATITAKIDETLSGATIPVQPDEKDFDARIDTTFDDVEEPVENAEVRATSN